jgi:uncharacterized protein
MSLKWISPKIIVGNVAKGDYYYPRPDIVELVWEELEKGNNVLLAAPRRVGKSSVMIHMAANCPAGYQCVFETIQGIQSDKELYQRFYELIVKCLKPYQKTMAWVSEIWKEHKIEEITIDGKVRLKEGTVNYLQEINSLLPKLNRKELKLVLFIDELPEVLHNLHKMGNTKEASSILSNIRRWRQEDQFKNLHFVLAGSVGISYVVKQIEGRTTDINDFNTVPFEPLTQPEAIRYLQWATDNAATIQYNKALANYLLTKIQYQVPYFINLMLDEINKKARRANQTNITTKDIDTAFDQVIKKSDHFRDWKSRIFDYMPPADATFVNDVLIYIAHKDSISHQKIYDLAVVHKKVAERMDMIDGLEKDGYITEDNDQYVFLSPFLKTFWKRNNPIYNG